jgi:hypothetical protein
MRLRYVAWWIRCYLNFNRGAVIPRRLAWVGREFVGQIVIGPRVESEEAGQAEAATPTDDATPYLISGPSLREPFGRSEPVFIIVFTTMSNSGDYASPKNEAVADDPKAASTIPRNPASYAFYCKL